MDSNLLFFYCLPLAFALGLVTAGPYCLVRDWRGSKPGISRLNRCGIDCLVAVFGLLLTGGVLTSPSPRWRVSYVDSMLNAGSENVASITITPHRAGPAFPQLVQSQTIICDRASIRTICSALHQAKPILPNHPTLIWTCQLRLRLPTGDYSCLVNQTTNNGCYFVLGSDEGFSGKGTIIGNYRSDSLSRILESLVQ